GRMAPALARYSEAHQKLLRAVAAGVALHYSGVFAQQLGISDADMPVGGTVVEGLMRQYMGLHQDRKEGEKVARACGLRKNEIEAVWSYTQANKAVETLG